MPQSGSVSASPPRSSAAASRGQEVRALVVGAVAADELRHHEVRVDHAGERHPRPRDRLDDAHVGRRREPQPAVLLGDGRGEQPELAHLLHHLARVLVGVLELHHVRDDLARQPALERLEHRVFIGGRHGVLPALRLPAESTCGIGCPDDRARRRTALRRPDPRPHHEPLGTVRDDGARAAGRRRREGRTTAGRRHPAQGRVGSRRHVGLLREHQLGEAVDRARLRRPRPTSPPCASSSPPPT